MVVGVPILAGVLALGGYIGGIEAELLGRLRGRDMSITLADPNELSVTEYLKTVVTTPATTCSSRSGSRRLSSVSRCSLPLQSFFGRLHTRSHTFLYWMPGVEYEFTGLRGTIEVGSLSVDAGSVVGASINTLPEALAASAVGVVVCLAGLHAVNLSAWLLAGLTERLLTILSE